MSEIDSLSVSFNADTSNFRKGISDCDKLAKGFGKTMSSSLATSIVQGKSLGDTLQNLGTKMTTMLLKNSMQSMFQGVFSGAKGLLGNLFGGGGGSGDTGSSFVTPFAKGGVVSSPSYFPMQGGTGLMGEAGAEAIMPLSRTSDGRLGVAAQGNKTQNITFNVQANDAASFKKSEGEINAMLARAVGRGGRSL